MNLGFLARTGGSECKRNNMSLFSLVLFIHCFVQLVCSTYGQNTGSNGTSGLPVYEREEGILLTAEAGPQSAHLIHVPFMPYYKKVPRPALFPAWQFTVPTIDILSVDIDFREKNLFLFDRDSRSILAVSQYKAPVTDGPIGGHVYYLDIGVANGAVQIAYDWMSKTLYWVDSALKWIVATSGDIEKFEATKYVNFNKFTIILERDLEHPEGLAVDPLAGYMFFCDNGRHPKIERIQLDGSQDGRKTLVTNGLENPLSLEADIFMHRVYWVDHGKDTVEYVKYDGSGRGRVGLQFGGAFGDLGIFRDLLVVTDIQFGRAYFVNKTSGVELEDSLQFKDEYLYGVVIYNIENQPMKQIEGKNCSELDCEHICVSTTTVPRCMCYEGYKFNETTNRCEETNVGEFHRALVIATKTQICLADTRALNVFHPIYYISCTFNTLNPVLGTTTTTAGPNATTSKPYKASEDPANEIVMFDLDIQKRIVYFVTADNSIFSRPIDLPVNTSFRNLIVADNRNITGMVFDWVNGNDLYWIESSTRTLQVTDITTRFTMKVADLGEGMPSNLVMLYRQRVLAWASRNTSGVYNLMTLKVDEQKKTTLVPGRTDIVSLTVDDEKQILYWIEQDHVLSVAFDTKVVQQVTTMDSSDYSLLLQYKNFLTWGNPKHVSGTWIHSYLLDTQQGGTSGSFGLSYKFVDMKVLDVSLTPGDLTASNPCARQNGGCEQICINHYNGQEPVKTCRCTVGFRLMDDGTCVSDFVEKDFALVTDITLGKVLQINLNDGQIHAFKDRDDTPASSVFFNKLKQEVVWGERYSPFVFSDYLNGTNRRILDSRAFGQPGDFALDETTGNLYYADSRYPFNSTVRVLTPQGFGMAFPEFHKIAYGDFIVAIDVHPQKGWMYVGIRADYSASYIIRANLDGSNPVILHLNTPITFPLLQGLVIDHWSDHIYWSEFRENKIYKCNLDLADCEMFYQDTVANIRELDTDGELLYFTAWNYQHLKAISLDNKVVTILGKSVELGKLETVSVYKTTALNLQKVSEPCRDRNGLGNCSTICFPTETGRTCACEYNVTLLADKRTCSNVFQCAETFIEKSANRLAVTFEEDCLRYVGVECNFNCPQYYAPISNENDEQKLKCTNSGWDRQNDTLCREVHCPHTTQHGRIATNCTYRLSDSCMFSCNKGYYQNPFVKSLTCQSDRTWHSAGEKPCLDVYCPTTISYGKISDQCDRQVRSTCSYECDTNYKKNTNVMSIHCQEQGYWNQTNNLCQEILCPNTILNGVISPQCDRRVGSNCSYVCTSPFVRNQNVTEILCKADGNWSQTTNLCFVETPVVSQAQTSKNKEVGIGVGVAVAAVVILILIVLAFMFRRRMGSCGKKELDVPPASYANDQIDGIENPGYLTADIRITDDGYDQARATGTENPYNTITENAKTDGPETFHFGNGETLPEKKEIQSPDGDKVYLTADSWLKQQQEQQKQKEKF